MPIDQVRSLVSEYYDNTVLLETALGVDYFFEEIANIYPYPNWFKGEVLAGPDVRRYWVAVVLKYKNEDMPDPDGADVLRKLGCRVWYKKFFQKSAVDVKSYDDLDQRHRPKMKSEVVWLLKILIPKKYFEMKNLADLNNFSQDIDTDGVETALNDGLYNGSVIK